MRTRSTLLIIGGTVALVGLALLLASAGRGRAASGNICNTPTIGTSPNLTPASCVAELVAPNIITAGNDALSVTKFFNQAGSGGATATHVVLSVTFPGSDTQIDAVNGSPVVNNTLPSNCTATTSPIGVSCSYGNVSGGGSARLSVQFRTSTPVSCNNTVTTCITGAATYGEGAGNPSGVPNDYQVNYAGLGIASASDASVKGGCFPGTPNPLTGSTTSQATFVSNVPDESAGFGCTFVEAGVNPTIPPGFHTQVSFVQFPLITNGYANVTISFTPLPSPLNWKTFPLWEDTGSATLQVGSCLSTGFPATGDSCIVKRTKLSNGGVSILLDVIGSPFDGSYWG